MSEPDITNFSTSSSHRLPTISASQALKDASSSRRSTSIPSSLPGLDTAFLPPAATTTTPSSHNPQHGGIPRSQVTEIYGPPGVGKTALGMQLACNALHQGHHVVWIDTGAPIPGPRFKDMVSSYGIPAGHEPPSSPPIERSMHDLLENMTHFHVPSLAHLLALFLHPTPAFPPANTALIIVDNVSAPFATAFPRSSDVKGGSLDPARRSKLQWAANRKWAVAGDLAAAMVKMAALRSVAVVAISQVATSLKGVGKAVLKSAIAGTAWEAAVHNRIVLWRDFAPHGGGAGVVEPSMARRLRLAKVVKTGRKMKPGNSGDVVAFAVEKACSSKSAGLEEIDLAVASPVLPKTQQPSILETTSTKTTKRKVDEIADSEGDEEDEEADELGSNDDFGIPNDDLFNEAVLEEQRGKIGAV